MPNHPKTLQAGLRFHRSGKLGRAEAEYRQVLQREPENAAALHLLGLTLADAGRYEEAGALMVRAIRIMGPDPALCAGLAAVLSMQGNWKGAAACYRQAVGSEPDNVDLYYPLGYALAQAGELEQAVPVFEAACRLRPEASQPRQALIEALCVLGMRRCGAGHPGEGVEFYRRAAAVDPARADIRYNLGVACRAANRLEEAAAHYREALQLDPEHTDARNNLANILQQAGRPAEAVELYRAVIARRPHLHKAHYNLGLALHEVDRLHDAEASYREAIRLCPENARAHNNLGNVLLALGNPRAALECYLGALRLEPANIEFRSNLAIVHLLLGDLERGWEEYAARLERGRPRFDRPLWDGTPLGDRRLLVHAEQGLGDTLQFVRFLPLVEAGRNPVVLECQPSLVRLAATVPGAHQVLPRGAALPEFDCQAPLMSLPGLLGTTLATLPREVPYLGVEPLLAERWAAFVGAHAPADARRVGLVWSGSAQHRNDRNRSLPYQELAALAGVPNTVFFNLQQGDRRADADALRGSLDLVEVGDLPDFAETAALLANLHLVISVDTAVAHLAGALGIPVWTLLPFAPDWRWLLEREDSPWYPSMRLFRQPRPKDWAAVMRNVREVLAQLAGR